MLTLLLLSLAGQCVPAADDTQDTPAAVIEMSAPASLQATTWTGLKRAMSTVALPEHHDADDERGLR